MSIGAAIRRLLGPFEPVVIRLYRAAYLDVAAFVRAVRAWTDASTILEIGCGDGQVTEELRRAFPRASITGIDIQGQVGGLFRGDRQGVTFLIARPRDFAARNPGRFDLVVICDVLHHVPPVDRCDLLRDASLTLRKGGGIVIKEWERRTNLAHLFAWFADRFITGDKVRFETSASLHELAEETLRAPVERELRIPPCRNNLALFIRPSGVQDAIRGPAAAR
jgi:2-polyprenyl-3-methyl-5-hydroxy-6-metoxy-1,4-benzoquinol methylase